MDTLKTILRDTLMYYVGSGRGANIRLFPVFDDEHQVYAVTAVDYPTHKDVAGVVLLARIVGDMVVIEEDATDKSLLDRLEANGIPRDKIILAYAGEPVPDPIEMP
jgi:hypothetical protein